MALPNYQQLMLPLLRRASEKDSETRISELEDQIAKDLSLSLEDINALLPSAKQSIYLNRLNWAKSYLSKAGVLENTRRAFFKVTPRGKALLQENLDNIDLTILSRFPEFTDWRQTDRQLQEPLKILPAQSELNPEESLAVNFERLERGLSDELIQIIHSFSPAFFERLIIDLLLAMGYGGGRSEMGKALGRSGDGGIDGIVKEDELGLDVVYIQAKRYAITNGVPVSDVRGFVGSLSGHRANKGVFVTTSYFPESARTYIGQVRERVILIDGKELARLMIRHKVGVRVKDTYEIKKIDEDYFVEW